MFDTTEAKRLADAAKKALIAIAEGYRVQGLDDRFIVVENPDYQPDNGSNVNLVIDAGLVAASLRDAVAEIERLREVLREVWGCTYSPTDYGSREVDIPLKLWNRIHLVFFPNQGDTHE